MAHRLSRFDTETRGSRFPALGPAPEPESSLPPGRTDGKGERSGQAGGWCPRFPSSQGGSLSDRFEVVPRLSLRESVLATQAGFPPGCSQPMGNPQK